MPTSTSSQSVGLLERRIIELLTTTNLTFKEIILQLDGENLSASIGIIRRINRDNRYRRPRYDSKLTPAQRESLVEELRDHQGVKPNLSLLAKRYGVCHGSVWYWWDKLNRVKQRCDPRQRGRSFSAKSLLRRSQQMQFLSAAVSARHNLSGANALRTRSGMFKQRSMRHNDEDFKQHQQPFQVVGRVSVVMHDSLSTVELPILMFSRGGQVSCDLADEWPLKLVGPRVDTVDLLAESAAGPELCHLSEHALPLIKAEP